MLPDYFKAPPSRHRFVTISDPKARWDYMALWQRGKTPSSITTLVNALKEPVVEFSA
ncbi:hypothetical protein GCM10023213_37090 [Prosthecobacter algae]|uniref:LysR family transcriptional regulator n=1 Tax=Prosthecobacter algae TaxID=1144682 RepID=A0ABP9PES1_9BACT